MPRRALVAAAVFLLLPTAAARAAEDQPPAIARHRIVYEEALGVRINPIGVEDQHLLSFRERLYEHASLALRENYLGIGLSPTLAPAVSRFGGHVEVRPLTMLSLTAGFYQVGYVGTFGALQSFPDATHDYSDKRLSALKKAGTNYPAKGFEVHLRGIALGKLGPVAFRSDTSAFYTDVSLRKGDTVYYGPRLDLVERDKGWVLTTDEDVAYLSTFGLVAGARFSTGNTFVDAPHGSSSTMRLGPVLAYSFFNHPNASFNKPTLLGIVQWWLAHPYRTGKDISQAIPYVLLAFRFEGELWHAD